MLSKAAKIPVHGVNACDGPARPPASWAACTISPPPSWTCGRPSVEQAGAVGGQQVPEGLDRVEVGEEGQVVDPLLGLDLDRGEDDDPEVVLEVGPPGLPPFRLERVTGPDGPDPLLRRGREQPPGGHAAAHAPGEGGVEVEIAVEVHPHPI